MTPSFPPSNLGMPYARPWRGSVAVITACSFDRGQVVELQIDNRLQGGRGRRVAQRVRQGLEPSCISSPKDKQFIDRVVPPLRPGPAVNGAGRAPFRWRERHVASGTPEPVCGLDRQ